MRNSRVPGGTMEVLLMEIAEGLSVLIKNPDLSQKIKEVYALNDAEKIALEEARKTLGDADNLRAELAQEAKKYADMQSKIDKQNTIKKDNSELLEAIKKERELSTEKMTEITKGLQDLEALSKALDDRGAALDLREKKLNEAFEDLNRQRAEIRSALDKSKTILGGLG